MSARRDVADAARGVVNLAHFRLLAESVDEAITLHDSDGTIMYASPAAGRLAGCRPADLVGTAAVELVDPEDRERLRTRIDAAGRGIHWGEPDHPAAGSELRLRRADGSEVRAELRASVVRDDAGRPAHILCVWRDGSGRTATAEALARAEACYTRLAGRAGYGIFRAAGDGRLVDASPALARMLGYDAPEQLLGVAIAIDVFVAAEEWERAVERAARGEADEWTSVRWRRRGGAAIVVRLAMRAEHDAGGAVRSFDGLVEDVTERERREELLLRGERMASAGTTLAGVAHELNNPLASIRGFAQLLLLDERTEYDRSALETINREAGRASKIVKDLLAFTRRPDAAPRGRVDLDGVVRHVAETQRYATATRGIRVDLDLDGQLPPVMADRARLEQLVLNLVMNARQALEMTLDSALPSGRDPGVPPPARIEMRTRSEAGHVILDVSDNGPGIAARDLPRIWDPFWTTKEAGEGTGLGLSIAHGIVTAHSGTIEVVSEENALTRFRVTLPAAADKPGWRDAETAGGGRASAALDVLLVDDEETILTFLSRYLGSRGHAVMVARDGAAALRLAEQSPFDVIVCDLRMPGMEGGAAIRRLRELPTCAAARYVVSTGDSGSSPARQRLAELDPPVVVVEKPYEIERLRLAVEGGEA